MINSDILTKICSFWCFYRWHPEVALRYLPIVDAINKLGKDITILEIGSGGLGITPYLKRDVTGVDIDFQPPYHRFLKMIKASATNLPLKDSSFEIALCVDTLEHLSQTKRKKAISEMLRIARKKVIIALPCGKDSTNEDILLAEFSKKHSGKILPFLQEHLKYRLPEKEEIIEMIESGANKYNKEVKITIRGNESIFLHRFLLKGYMVNNFWVDFFFRKILLLAISIMRLFNKEPTYRKIFFVDII